MASPLVDVATDMTIVFATSGFTANILTIMPTGYERESIDTSHQQTPGAMTFTPAHLYNAGGVDITGHFNPDTAPPIEGGKENVTITWPSGATWAFSAFVTKYQGGADNLDQRMDFSMTIKISGAITIAAGSS